MYSIVLNDRVYSFTFNGIISYTTIHSIIYINSTFLITTGIDVPVNGIINYIINHFIVVINSSFLISNTNIPVDGTVHLITSLFTLTVTS